jgi:hypothetical protein
MITPETKDEILEMLLRDAQALEKFKVFLGHAMADQVNSYAFIPDCGIVVKMQTLRRNFAWRRIRPFHFQITPVSYN